MILSRLSLLALLVAWAGNAWGQQITFSSDIVQADGQATPTLIWDTTPLADDCIASGDWSGNKGGAGIEQLLPITSSATYNLSCSWLDDKATLSWSAPTENTDGTPYTDASGYLINFGPGVPPADPEALPGILDRELSIADPALTSTVIPGLSVGVWSFVIRARNQRDVLSDFSNTATKTISAAETSESIGIQINPVPKPATGLTVE